MHETREDGDEYLIFVDEAGPRRPEKITEAQHLVSVVGSLITPPRCNFQEVRAELSDAKERHSIRNLKARRKLTSSFLKDVFQIMDRHGAVITAAYVRLFGRDVWRSIVDYHNTNFRLIKNAMKTAGRDDPDFPPPLSTVLWQNLLQMSIGDGLRRLAIQEHRVTHARVLLDRLTMSEKMKKLVKMGLIGALREELQIDLEQCGELRGPGFIRVADADVSFSNEPRRGVVPQFMLDFPDLIAHVAVRLLTWRFDREDDKAELIDAASLFGSDWLLDCTDWFVNPEPVNLERVFQQMGREQDGVE